MQQQNKPIFTNHQLITLLWPLIIEQALEVLVGMADTMMVSSAGEAAISGVSLVDMINQLIITIFGALATGGAVVTSQYLGARKNDAAARSAGQLVTLSAILGCAIAAFCLVGRTLLLRLFFGSITDDVMEAALIYFTITALSFPFLALYNAGAAIFRSTGNSAVSMKVSVIVNIINFCGNALCVYVLKMGVAGVAVPTLVSRAVGAVIILSLASRHDYLLRLTARSVTHLEGGTVRSILAIGIPSACENSLFQLGRVLVVSMISLFGTVHISANAVANNLDNVGCIIGNAMCLGMITVVGRCVGAREYGQARHYARRLLLLNYGFSAVVCTVMVLGAGAIVGIYQLSPEAAAEAQRMITVHSFFMILHPISFTLPNALRASYDAKFTMVVSIFSMWMFRVLLAYWFVRTMNLGIMGVWYGMYVDWAFRALMFELRFRGYEKRMGRIGAHEAFSS